MKFIDICCGAGLFTEGIKEGGHQPVLGIDNWKLACESYEANHCEAHCEDILKTDFNTLPKVDLIIGSPPCQKFSVMNTKTRTLDDTLIKKFAEIIGALQPKYWIMEEVPGAIKSVPVSWRKHILKATDFGGKQIRKRLFAGKFNPILVKMQGVKKAPTVTTGWNRLSNKENTKFRFEKEIKDHFKGKPSVSQIRELMGVSEDYVLCGSWRNQIKQLGNGVYVPLAKALGEALKA